MYTYRAADAYCTRYSEKVSSRDVLGFTRYFCPYGQIHEGIEPRVTKAKVVYSGSVRVGARAARVKRHRVTRPILVPLASLSSFFDVPSEGGRA